MAQLVDDLVLDASAGVHRPRNLDWKRAAALLYGDWGTSKAYVIGLGEMYVADPRFGANYATSDGGTAGAEFVRDALRTYAEANL